MCVTITPALVMADVTMERVSVIGYTVAVCASTKVCMCTVTCVDVLICVCVCVCVCVCACVCE